MQQNLVIALVRHGEYQQPQNVPGAMLPYGLTPVGEAQARQCATTLLDFSQRQKISFCSEIDCSRMLRAWQTASLIGQSLGERLEQKFLLNELDCLAERSVGAAANLSIQDIESLLANDPRYVQPPRGWKSSSHYRLPFQGAESLDMAGKRVAAHISAILQKNSQTSSQTGGLKLIVGHGAAIRHAAVQLGILRAADVRSVSMHHAVPVFISPDSGRWDLIAGNWKPRVNESEDEFSVE